MVAAPQQPGPGRVTSYGPRAIGSAGTSWNHKKSIMRQFSVILLRQNTWTILGIAPVADVMYVMRRGKDEV
jgi:hypothetical protein